MSARLRVPRRASGIHRVSPVFISTSCDLPFGMVKRMWHPAMQTSTPARSSCVGIISPAPNVRRSTRVRSFSKSTRTRLEATRTMSRGSSSWEMMSGGNCGSGYRRCCSSCAASGSEPIARKRRQSEDLIQRTSLLEYTPGRSERVGRRKRLPHLCRAQGVGERLQNELHVFGRGAVAHGADAEDLAGQRSESAGDLHAVFLQEKLPDLGVVDACGNARRVERPQAVAGGNEHAQAHGFDAGDEGLVVAAVALPTRFQTFLGDHGETFAQGVEHGGGRRVVILVAGVKSVE